MSFLRPTLRARQIAAHLKTPSVSPVRLMSTASEQSYEHIIVTHPAPRVALVTLNRPKALNALCNALIAELNTAFKALDRDDNVGAIVLTGNEKAFAAGADIKEMKDKTFAEVYKHDFIRSWSEMTQVTKPIIAAVRGYALGGGCELAMMADIIYAADTATFGQPEIKLGIIPGAGGTQRLPRLIGRSRAMELILTGRNFSAQEAYSWGMVARLFPSPRVVEEAVSTAEQIGKVGGLAVKAAKEAINLGEEMGLSEGVKFERRLFHGLFSTADQKEGMAAFAEKRKAQFKHE